MSEKKVIDTDNAPKAIGPYSQGVAFGDFLFTSGQLPIDPATGLVTDGNIQDQAHQALKNLKAIAESAGANLNDIVKTTVFLADINDFKSANEVYEKYFEAPFPARSAFQVAALPLGAGIEIEAIISLK